MLQLILELREMGVEPFVLLPSSNRNNNDLRDHLDRENITWMQTRFRRIKDGSFKHCISNYIKSLWYSRHAVKLLKEHKFDMVHSNGSLFDMGSWIACDKGIPHIWHLREFGNLDYGLRTPFGKWYQHVIYGGKNNHFIAISKSIFNYYKKYVNCDRMDVIYNGIPADDYFHQSSTFTAPLIELCLVGLLHEPKRQLDALKALSKVIQRGHRNVHLHLVGAGDHDYVEKLEETIERYHLEAYVTMQGNISNIPQFLEGKHIGLMTSSSEAFGRVTIEYMMAGMAVIASDTGANPEIVVEGTGLLYPCGNYEKLADNIIKLIEYPDQMAQLAIRGQQRAIETFTSEANAEKVKALYDRILQQQVYHS